MVSVEEARPLDFLEALDDTGRQPLRWTKLHFARIAEQINLGTGVTIRAQDGRLALMAGLFPDEDGLTTEAWFAAGPALRANFRTAMTAARRLLDEIGPDLAPLRIVAFIHPDSVAGSRLAAWFGFRADGVGETWRGPLERWTRRFA